MNDFNAIVAILGGLILSLALGSKRLSASPLPPTLLALVIGVLIGLRSSTSWTPRRWGTGRCSWRRPRA